MCVSPIGERRGFHASVRHLRTLSGKLCRSLARRVTYCRKTSGATVLRIALAMVARYLTDQHLLPARWRCSAFRKRERQSSVMTRLTTFFRLSPFRGAGFPVLRNGVSSICSSISAAGASERGFSMLRPDHLYFAMLMTKHATLAGGLIYGVKILNYAIRSFLV